MTPTFAEKVTRRLLAARSSRLIGITLGAAISIASGSALAQTIVPPIARSPATAPWPRGQASEHDVVVPLLLTVRADGTVSSVEIETSVDAELDAAAVRAAESWTFDPAKRDGTPIASKIRAVVRFKGAPPPLLVVAPAAASAVPVSPTPPAAPPAVPAQLTVFVNGDGPARGASDVIRKRDVLSAAPHRTASDLLLVVPGVFITQHSGQGKAHQIFLRGFDAVHGQDVEIWVGGAPVNEVSNVHGQGYADLHFVMPEVVKQIRSRPGTYDPRQGDFAVAGSIGLDLGYNEPGLTAAATLGMFGERRYFLAYHPANAPDTTFAAFETESTDGFGPARAARRTSAIAQGTWDLGSFASARVMASTYNARFDSAGVLKLRDIESGAIDRFASYDPKQGGDSSRTQVVIALDRTDDEERSVWSLAPYFILRSLRLRSDYTGFLEDKINGDSQQQINDAVTVGATGSYRRRLHLLSDDDTLEGGISIRNDWITQSQLRLSVVNDATTKTLVDASIRATDIAAYADASLRPIRRVAVRGGLRIDGLSYAVQDRAIKDAGAARAALGAHVGAKATIDVVTLPGLHALASYGDGFRSPQARSLGDGERTPFTKVRSFEGGLRYADGDRIQASAAVFHTTLSDDLVFDQATARNEPVPATQRTGVAFELTLRPRPWITESGSITYTRASFTASDATYQAGDLVPYAPQLVARSDVALTPRLARFFDRDLVGHFGVGLTFLGARPLPYAELGHEIFLADTSVGLHFKEIELRADVTNLLGANWYDGEFTFASNFERSATPALVPARHVTAGAPRTFFATLSIHL